jgi:hypothetical protein
VTGTSTALFAASAGGTFPLLMGLRRLRAARRGRRLERHYQWRYLPWRYGVLWLVPVGAVVRYVHAGAFGLVDAVALLLFVALWATVGVIIWLDRRIELAPDRERARTHDEARTHEGPGSTPRALR